MAKRNLLLPRVTHLVPIFRKEVEHWLVQRTNISPLQGNAHQRAEHALGGGLDIPRVRFMRPVKVTLDHQPPMPDHQQAVDCGANPGHVSKAPGQSIGIRALGFGRGRLPPSRGPIVAAGRSEAPGRFWGRGGPNILKGKRPSQVQERNESQGFHATAELTNSPLNASQERNPGEDRPRQFRYMKTMPSLKRVGITPQIAFERGAPPPKL